MHGRATKIITNTLAILVILGFIAIIANSLRIFSESRHIHGPTVLTTDAAGKVYINIAATLHVLDATGRHEDSIPLAELGLHGATLTDLLALPDGRLLIGSSDSVKIRACNLSEHHCAPFIQSGTQPVSAFKMAWDAQRQRLLVVDGERHRILVYDRNGALALESRGGEQGLKLPNTVLLTAEGTAIIADTNHHRLVALDAETLSAEHWEMPTGNALGTFRRIWPTDFAQAADRRFWVILADDLLENGDVVLFDSAQRPVLRLALPADWDPVKLQARDRDVLLAGFGSLELVRISLQGDFIEPFGDRSFREALAQVREQQQAATNWWHTWIWMAIAPLAVLAGVAAWLDWRNRNGVTGAAESTGTSPGFEPATGEIHWLEPKPEIVRLWRYSRWLSYVLPLLLLAPALFITGSTGCAESGGFTILLLAGTLPLMVMLVTSVNTLSKGRLGVTRDRVVLGSAGGSQRQYYPRQIVYGPRFISSGDITVFTATGKGALFDAAEFRFYLEPLLASARKLNSLQGYLYLLQQGNRLTWVNTLGIACLGGLYLHVKLFMG
ncbi:MAG: hypothetical protein PVH38_08240 [Gammaproteobacteria bacterium]|jgi:hypothetical protein